MKKILVVDDEPSVLGLAKHALEEGGYEVHVCDTGRRALEELARLRPDLLILDVMLPGVDGFTVMGKISADEDSRALAVIVFTALEAARVLFQKFPQVKAYVAKPFSPAELLKTARAILEPDSAQAEPA